MSNDDADCAEHPGEFWATTSCKGCIELALNFRFKRRRPPLMHLHSIYEKYSCIGILVSTNDSSSHQLTDAWHLLETLYLREITPEMFQITLVGGMHLPLALVRSNGELELKLICPQPGKIRSVSHRLEAIVVRDEVTTEWKLVSNKKVAVSVYRHLCVAQQSIQNCVLNCRSHLPSIPPGLFAELAIGIPAGKLSRCIDPKFTPMIQRFADETVSLLWSNAKIIIVDSRIVAKQLTHKVTHTTLLPKGDVPIDPLCGNGV